MEVKSEEQQACCGLGARQKCRSQAPPRTTESSLPAGPPGDRFEE